MHRSAGSRAPRWRLILNGKAAGNEAVREAVRGMRERGVDLGVRVTWETGDAARFTRLAVEDAVDAVIAGGGDGTLGEVAGALADEPGDAASLPALGLVPLGTANDFATAAALPTAPDEALALLHDGRPRHVDLLRIRDGERVSWCINLASGGFGTQVTVETGDGLKKLLGGLAYVVSGIAQLGRIDTTTLHVHGPGFAWDGEMIALGLGNGRQAGGGQVLCPDALVDDGLLDLTIVPELSGDVAATMGRLVTGGREVALDHVAVRARLPWIELAGAAPLSLNLDGEPLEAARMRVECVPGRLRMHLPAACPLLAIGPPGAVARRPVHIADPH